MKIEKTVNEQEIRWKLTNEVDRSWVEVYWPYGCPNVVILNYGPRGGHRDVAVLPLAMLDELITLARNRPELTLKTITVEELSGLPIQEYAGKA